jgi:hypothetical protein
MDPVFVATLAKYGIEAVLEITQAWKQAGEPTREQIEALKNLKDPEAYFQP